MCGMNLGDLPARDLGPVSPLLSLRLLPACLDVEDLGFLGHLLLHCRERSVRRGQRACLWPLARHPFAVWFVQLSMPPACPARSRLQLPHRQPSAWRACRPRAPASPPVRSSWNHPSCPRAPQSLPSTPLAPLGPLPASLPTPPCPLPGSWCRPAWTGCLKPALGLPPMPGAARVPRQPSPAVTLPPAPLCWLETRALCLLLEPHPRSCR